MTEEEEFYILGIDPGTRNVGLSFYKLNGKLDIISIETFNLFIDIEGSNGIGEQLIYRITRLAKMLTCIYKLFSPYMVIMESSFIDIKNISAVIPLSKAISCIEMTIRDIDEYAKLISIAPRLAKKIFGAELTGKEAVKDALMKKDEVLSKIVNKNYTEHEIDAIAIAYALLTYLREERGMPCIKYLERC